MFGLLIVPSGGSPEPQGVTAIESVADLTVCLCRNKRDTSHFELDLLITSRGHSALPTLRMEMISTRPPIVEQKQNDARSQDTHEQLYLLDLACPLVGQYCSERPWLQTAEISRKQF